MAVTYRAASSLTAVSGTSFAVTMPAGAQVGDLAFLAIHVTTSATNIVRPPAGWMVVPKALVNGTKNIVVWCKVVATGEPGNSITVTATSSVLGGLGIVVLYSSLGQGLKVADVATSSATTSTNRVFPAVTLPSAGMALHFGHLGSNQTSTPPGDATEVWDTTVSASRGYLMHRTLASSGSTGTSTATGTTSTLKAVTIGVVEGAFSLACPQIREWAITPATSAASSVSVVLPSTIQAGDLLFLQFGAISSRTPTTPTDWTLVRSQTGANGTWLYSKTAVLADASATVTVSFSGGSSVVNLVAVSVYSPRGKLLRIDESALSAFASASTHTYPAVTTTTVDGLWLMFGFKPNTVGYDLTDDTDVWRWYDSGVSSMRSALLFRFLRATGSTSTYAATLASAADGVGISVGIVEYDPPAVDLSRKYLSERAITLTFNGVDVTAYLRSENITAEAPALLTMSLEDADPTSLPGAIPWKVELEGMLDKTVDDLLGKDAIANGRTANTFYRAMVLAVGETGNGTTYTWTAGSNTGAFVADYQIGLHTQFQEIPFSSTILASGAPVRGTW